MKGTCGKVSLVILLIITLLQVDVTDGSVTRVVATHIENSTKLLDFAASSTGDMKEDVAVNSTVELKEVEALRAEVARLKAKARDSWATSANRKVSEIRDEVMISGELRKSSDQNLVQETREVIREAETQIIEESHRTFVEETTIIETEVVEVIEVIETVESKTSDRQVLMEVETLKVELAALRQQIHNERRERELNTRRIMVLHKMFGEVENVIREVSAEMVERQSTHIMQAMTKKVQMLIQQSVATETIVKETIIKETTIKTQRTHIIEQIKEVIREGSSKETIENTKEIALLNKKVNWLKKKLDEQRSDPGNPELEAMVKKLKITIQEMKESQEKATLVRSKNVQDIATIKEIILQMDISKDITKINTQINKQLTEVEISINAVSNRVTAEIQRQNQELAKIQERLTITEERIVEIGQDLKETQNTVKHLQELTKQIQSQQSTTKSEVIKETLKIVDTRIEDTTKIIVEKHMKSIETRSKESITQLTKLIEKIQGGLMEEREEREKSDAETAKLKIQIQELINQQDDTESEEAIEELQERIQKTEEMIERESIERKRSEAGVESMKEIIKVIQERISSESASIRVIETRIKEIMKTQTTTIIKIERLRKEAEESNEKLERTIEDLRGDVEKEEQLRKESDSDLRQLKIFVQQISVTVQKNSLKIRNLRRELTSETKDIREEVQDIEEKMKVLVEGLSNTAQKAGAPCPDGCDSKSQQQQVSSGSSSSGSTKNSKSNLVCASKVSTTVFTKQRPLCARSSGSDVTYFGRPCGDGRSIEWTSMKTDPTQIIAGYTEKQCSWDIHGKSASWKQSWTGSCGVAPTRVPDLPTRCTTSGSSSGSSSSASSSSSSSSSSSRSSSSASSKSTELDVIKDWTYYATGCGGGSYLRQMTGTFDECLAACAQSADCYGLQRNGNNCYLDDDAGNQISGRISGKPATTKVKAMAASWYCAVKGSSSGSSSSASISKSTELDVIKDWARSTSACKVPFENVIRLTKGPAHLSSIKIYSDWWMKRPKDIEIDVAGSVVATVRFPNSQQICGADCNSKCKYPDDGKGSAKSCVKVKLPPDVANRPPVDRFTIRVKTSLRGCNKANGDVLLSGFVPIGKLHTGTSGGSSTKMKATSARRRRRQRMSMFAKP